MSSNMRPVILCGGSGTRLWPLSRESFPKQFVPLIEGQSLMDLTIARTKSWGAPICVTNEEHRFFVQELLNANPSSHSKKSPSILLEPAGRNTAAAMACASLIPDIGDTDLLLFLPADHFVPDVSAFVKTMESGVAAAKAGHIVTFGVQPSFPSTAYGYVQQGSTLSNQSVEVAYTVRRFIEKPPPDLAQQMLLAGGYLWNAGIFLCQAGVLKQALAQHAPDILASSQSAMQSAQVDGDFVRPHRDSFLACRSESIDYAVMEHFDKVAVIPFQGSWSDVGSWNAVAALSSADEAGNRIHGQGLVLNARNTYINAPHRPVVALGTFNLLIIDTPDAVLVAAANQVEQVKEVVIQLKDQGSSQAIMHRRVPRPWGWYDSIDAGERFQVKRISVKPGAALSLQLHHHRAEHWIVVKGVAKVTNHDQTFFLKENQSTYIPPEVKHRLENPGAVDLEMIEVQSGNYLGEDDIVRFDDSYGRA